MDGDDFESASKALACAELHVCDFAVSIDRAGAGDFVYADPPYNVKHNMNGFVKYNNKLFEWSDQEKLQERLLAASDRGAKVLVSNANHVSISSLYNADWYHYVVSRASVISAGAQHRGQTTELLISNFEIEWDEVDLTTKATVDIAQARASR